MRGAFNTQVQRREEAVSAASNALEFAFDFMEQAFEDGQEMVVFVNELALGPDSAPFLAENDCERFEQYSESCFSTAARMSCWRNCSGMMCGPGSIRRSFDVHDAL